MVQPAPAPPLLPPAAVAAAATPPAAAAAPTAAVATAAAPAAAAAAAAVPAPRHMPRERVHSHMKVGVLRAQTRRLPAESMGAKTSDGRTTN